MCTSWTFCSSGNDPCRHSCKSDFHLDGTCKGTCRRVVVVSVSMRVAVLDQLEKKRKIMMYEQPNPGPNTKPHAGIIHVAPLFYSC